jgi:prepilin-type N-terminal cleavage/methylation domain-containing protein
MEYFGYYEDKDAYDGREEIRENAQRKGFTLVEVMVCIGILGAVLAIVAPPIVRLIKGENPGISSDWRMTTVEHEGHRWVLFENSFSHHPDCPCRNAEAAN